jgi:hypothetical protein
MMPMQTDSVPVDARTSPTTRWRVPGQRGGLLHLAAFACATVSVLVFIAVMPQYLAFLRDRALCDVSAYYEAAGRLASGGPLYPAGANVDASDFYRYPPLLALVLRPVAGLPLPVVAAGWEALMFAAFAATLLRLGIRRRSTWIAVAILVLPIAMSLGYGQAQVLVTFLLAIGAPWSVALAGQLKVFPALAALYWVGRRDWRSLRSFVAWSLVLTGVQVILAPAAVVDFVRVTNLDQVGGIDNLSPYGASPLLWGMLVVLGAIVVLTLARTKAGWLAAVAFSTVATPRLFYYLLMALLGGLSASGRRDDDAADRLRPARPTVPG